MTLAPYASHPEHSRGRLHGEGDNTHSHDTRSAFQRDRDRIVHCTAFRRLVYKTQVFLNHEGDLFRTRLTHSLEVAQLARSLARSLRLNEDLVEAIALAHDLGHTPFGHAGQDALNECMQPHKDQHGGFEHNLQSLRVVDELEERYPAFNGLNLSFETREGILKHCSAANAQSIEAREPGGVAQRFIHGTRPSIEAQVVNLADEMAYSAHDIDDGVRSGLINLEQLQELPLVARFHAAVLQDYPDLNGRRLLFEIIRRLLSAQVFDAVEATRAALAAHRVDSPDACRAAPPLVSFSPEMRQNATEVKQWLFHNLYRHPQVTQTTQQAQGMVRQLFSAYATDAEQMPAAYAYRPDTARAVADYIAGMTDRFAAREFERLFGPELNRV
jgi:dGTPase